MVKHVAFYWVPSNELAARNASLEDQRELAHRYVRDSIKVLDEVHASDHTVVRSLERAVRAARRYNAALLIPRIRPLFRRPELLRCLIRYNVEVVSLDGSAFERLSHRELSAALQRCLEFSPRIISGLQRAKARGARLGNPNISAVQSKGTLAAKENAKRVMRNPDLLNEVTTLRENGLSLRAIAADLNRKGIPTARGGLWHASTVRNVLQETKISAAVDSTRRRSG